MADLVSARHAVEADLELTVAMSDQAKVEIADARGGRWLIEHDLPRSSAMVRHEKAIVAPDECLVVGAIDGIVVGHAHAFLTAAVDAQLCMIEELFVTEPARAIGVGSVMLAEVRAWAVEHNCAAIESQVLPGNREAKNFFERVGMKTRKMRVSADL